MTTQNVTIKITDSQAVIELIKCTALVLDRMPTKPVRLYSGFAYLAFLARYVGDDIHREFWYATNFADLLLDLHMAVRHKEFDPKTEVSIWHARIEDIEKYLPPT
ncbi:MAG TPA: hypothetical protein VG965_02410 [Patescibacteria group bacterium]|nr:hypothetical protein [Patescibacteria group bacterium]